MVKLSILIATMPSRANYFNRLSHILEPQLCEEVEILVDISMEYNIGYKRNWLLSQAKGEYVVYIDEDDRVSSDYIEKILAACIGSPDCIGISGKITTNGANEQQWHISKDFGYWYELGGIYYRTPNHISPVKRELALQAGFPNIPRGEDSAYSMRLFPMLKTENKIEGDLYFYEYRDK